MKFSIITVIFLASLTVHAEERKDIVVNEEGSVVAPLNLWEANSENIKTALSAYFVGNDDPRLSDARTPTPHYDTHGYVGSDPVGSLTPASFCIPYADGLGTLNAWISPATSGQSGSVMTASSVAEDHPDHVVTNSALLEWWDWKRAAPLKVANGTLAEPAYTFTAAPNSGLYRHTDGSMRLGIGGVEKARFQPTGESLYVVGNLAASGHMFSRIVMTNPGSATATGVNQVGDENTGIYYPGSDQWAVSTGGVRRLSINTTGAEFDLPLTARSLIVDLGSELYPSIRFKDDDDTGIYLVGANNIGFTTEGGLQSGVNGNGPYISAGGTIVQTWKGSRNVSGNMWERAVSTLSGNGTTGSLVCTYLPSGDPTGRLIAITGSNPTSWNGVYKVTGYNSTTGVITFATTNTATYVSGGRVARFLPLVKITGTGEAEVTGTLTAITSNAGATNCAHTIFGSAYVRCVAGAATANYYAGYTGVTNQIYDPTTYGSPTWWTGSYREGGAAYWGIMRFYYNAQSGMTPTVASWVLQGMTSGAGTITVNSTEEY